MGPVSQQETPHLISFSLRPDPIRVMSKVKLVSSQILDTAVKTSGRQSQRPDGSYFSHVARDRDSERTVDAEEEKSKL